MDIVLGVSMTPTAVRMALVEGSGADGVTLDQDSFDVAAGVSAATSDAPEQVVAAILGTRESAVEGGHHLTATGVAWTDHAAAARLRQALRAQRIEDVILVSELHAASALAQAIGEAMECERTALLFVEKETATLAVVRTLDGSVVTVASRGLQAGDALNELQDLVAGLETGIQRPEALFVVGSGVDIAALKPHLASRSAFPIYAPEDGDLALARGAALAAANAPRYEAATVGLISPEDTTAGPTQLAAAGYMAPLGYSAVPDDDDHDLVALCPDADDESAAAGHSRFVLVGSALSTIFVVGVVALAISLAVAIRPTADQRPVPGESAVVSNGAVPAPSQAGPPAPPPAPLETIQAPIPVVQEAPRTVVVAPKGTAPAPAPAAPFPAPAPVPAAVPVPAPATAPAAAPAPAPVIAPPIVVPVPIIPPIFQIPARTNPVPRYPGTAAPSTVPSTPPSTPSIPSTATPSATVTPTTQVPEQSEQSAAPTTTSYPTYTAPVTTQVPSGGSESWSGSQSDSGNSERDSGGSQSVWPSLWPFGS